MLKNLKKRFSFRETAKLKGTPGENLRDKIIEIGLKTAEESGYAAGNTTERLVNLAYQSQNLFERWTELVFGSEPGSALGRVAFKTTKDIARGDSVCTGLCLVSVTCEIISLCC